MNRYFPEILLILAMVVYGTLSRPAPVAPGLPEMIMVSCLVGMAGLLAGHGAIARQHLGPLLVCWLIVVLGWGRGISSGASWHLIVRDLVPALLWLIPSFCFAVRDHDINSNLLTAGLMLAGTIMALRFWGQVDSWQPGGFNGWPDYLANDPLLWTAGLLWAQSALHPRPLLGRSGRSGFIRVLMMGMAALCLSTLMMTFQRAVIGCVLIACVVMIWPLRGRWWVWFGAISGIAALVIMTEPGTVITALWHKQQSLGWNSRDQEWHALIDLVRDDPLSLWLGHGWGSSFASPAVADWRVGYVHSLPGYLFFKLGLYGLVIWVGIARFCVQLLRPLSAHAGFLPAILVPLLVSTSYKFPGTIMVLTVLVLISHPSKSSSADSNVRS